MPFSPIEWPTASRVTLCRVAWDAAYKDVVQFASADARDAYFDGLTGEHIDLERMTYLKPGEPVTVNVPYSQAYAYNYLMVENPALPVPGETTPPRLFYFVTNVSYVAPNTTALELQLDVWTTYIYGCEFGRAFVERGHIGVAVLYNRNGRDVSKILGENQQSYASAPEGLDIGSEYVLANHEWFDLSNPSGGGWRVIVVSTTNLAADWGTVESPNLETADGQKTDGLIGGCNVYSMTADNFKSLMDKLKSAPWVSKGIVTVTVFPSGFLTDGPSVSLGGVDANFLGDTPDMGNVYTTGNVWQQFSNGIPDRYHRLHKFWTYPYMYFELTNYNGAPALYKPQYLYTPNGYTSLSVASCASPPNIRLAMYPYRYGISTARNFVDSIQTQYATMDGVKSGYIAPGTNTDAAVWFQGFPQFTVVNDEYANYLASTTNSRAVSYAGAGWSLAKSNASAQLSYDQTMQGLDVAEQNKQVENIATAASGALGAVGSLLSGSVGGAVSGAIGTGIGLWSGNTQFANTQNLTRTQAGQNKSLADWANQGDYQQTIATIDAAVQDAALTQPSVSGQAGGDGFNLANGLLGIEVRYKTLDANSARIVGEYWLRYGYAVREFMQLPANLLCMDKFAYWKCAEVYLENAHCAEADKDAIRGIFAKGVTVWASPDQIGYVDSADNIPASGIVSYPK